MSLAYSRPDFSFRLESLFQRVPLDLDDEVYVYKVNTADPMSHYELYEVYKISDQSAPIVREIGSWSLRNGNGANKIVMEDKNYRRNDLRVSGQHYSVKKYVKCT